MNPDETSIPRRCRIELNTPAELAIRDAMFAVEDIGAHPLLTDAVSLLEKAKSKVADFVDSNHKDSRMANTTALAFDIVSDISRHPLASAPGVVGVGLPFSEDMALTVVKGLIETLAQSFGDSFNDLVLTKRDEIRKIVGPIALKTLDDLVHGLQGLKP